LPTSGRFADEDPRGLAIFDGPVRIQGITPTVQATAQQLSPLEPPVLMSFGGIIKN
jgi:hypothetical protein